MIQEKVKAISRNDSFNKAYASAISGEELRKRLYKEMRQWEWNEK